MLVFSWCPPKPQTHLTADHSGEVSLRGRKHVELSLIGALSLILSRHLQRQCVVVANEDLIAITGNTAGDNVTDDRWQWHHRSYCITASLSSLSLLPLHWQPEVRFTNVILTTVQKDMSLRNQEECKWPLSRKLISWGFYFDEFLFSFWQDSYFEVLPKNFFYSHPITKLQRYLATAKRPVGALTTYCFSFSLFYFCTHCDIFG